MVNSILYGPGRNVSSPQTVSCPLQEKSPASYCCLEILAHVEVYMFFYSVNRDIYSDSHYKVWWWHLSSLFLWDIVVLCHWLTGAENSGQWVVPSSRVKCPVNARIGHAASADDTTMLPQNIGYQSPGDTAGYPRIMETSTALLWKCEN